MCAGWSGIGNGDEVGMAEVVRIALGIEYCGQGWSGWQHQPHAPSAQDALEAALSQVAGQPVAVVAAGRTDAGVHASGQVVHFDVTVERPTMAWVRGVNSHLSRGMAVLWAQPVTAQFHARYSALARSYRYVLLNRASRPGLYSGRVGWYHGSLDSERMQTAANFLLGEHDFSAFRATECQARSPIRDLRQLRITRMGDQIVFDLTANAFLHHMVRNMVGTLVWVGQGKRPPQWVADLLQCRDRHLAGPTASPDGLYLCHVDYAPHWLLPQAHGVPDMTMNSPALPGSRF